MRESTDPESREDGGGAGDASEDPTVPVTVRTGDGERVVRVREGSNLRERLLDAGFEVYGPLSRRLNCGGRGLCATCGVCLAGDAPPAEHWHDRLAVTFGYPRLSCQVTVYRPLTVALVDKLYWGQALPRRYDPGAERADAGVCRGVAGDRSGASAPDGTDLPDAGAGAGPTPDTDREPDVTGE